MTTERGGSSTDSIPGGALDDIAYLARSTNRIQLLSALAGEPMSRRDLDDATDASGTTLGRILSEFEQRDWARRRPDGDYEATTVGSHIAAEFLPLVDSVGAIRRLEEAVDWLPDDRSIGLEHFRDATVRRPERGDPVEMVDEFVQLLQSATRFTAMTDLVPPEPIAAVCHEGVVEGNLSMSIVTTSTANEYILDHPARLDQFREMVDGGADLYQYSGSLPCTLFVLDEVVWVKQTEAGGVHPSYGVPIETTNEVVREWALETIDSYRTESVRVTREWFPEPADVPPADSTNE